jgi:hypothetical protein
VTHDELIADLHALAAVLAAPRIVVYRDILDRDANTIATIYRGTVAVPPKSATRSGRPA